MGEFRSLRRVIQVHVVGEYSVVGASFVLTSFLWGRCAVIGVVFIGGVVGGCLGANE